MPSRVTICPPRFAGRQGEVLGFCSAPCTGLGDTPKHARRCVVLAALQVQEAGLKWRITVAEGTTIHLGSAVLPFRPRIAKVLSGLFAAPSKVRGACSRAYAQCCMLPFSPVAMACARLPQRIWQPVRASHAQHGV